MWLDIFKDLEVTTNGAPWIRNMTSKVWDSTSSESESYEVWKKLDKVSYIECRGFVFVLSLSEVEFSRLDQLESETLICLQGANTKIPELKSDKNFTHFLMFWPEERTVDQNEV